MDAIKRNTPRLLLGLFALLATPMAFAADEFDPRVIQLVWVATCCALVLFMQPGFALVESGLSRAKNSINVIMKNFADICIGSTVFWLFGYGLMFGSNPTGLFGTDLFMVQVSTPERMLDIVYQLLFAATAATIVSGAVAERIRFVPYLIGASLIMSVIYPIFGSWAWGGVGENIGWLKSNIASRSAVIDILAVATSASPASRRSSISGNSSTRRMV